VHPGDGPCGQAGRSRAGGGCPAARTVAGVAAVSVPSLAQSAKPTRETTGSPRRGTFAREIPIGGGRRLYLQCAGRGGPTVIIESGIHDSSDVWTLSDAKPPVVGFPTVFRGITRFTHVCMYDRPGTIRYANPPAQLARGDAAHAAEHGR
jgi:hypothetical protein